MVASDATTGALRIEKLPSSPDNPARAVLLGLERLIDGEHLPRGFGVDGATLVAELDHPCVPSAVCVVHVEQARALKVGCECNRE